MRDTGTSTGEAQHNDTHCVEQHIGRFRQTGGCHSVATEDHGLWVYRQTLPEDVPTDAAWDVPLRATIGIIKIDIIVMSELNGRVL